MSLIRLALGGWWAGALALTVNCAQAQKHPTDSSSLHRALPEVLVQRHRRSQMVGTLHEKFAPGAHALTPGSRVLIWLPAPDTSQVYALTGLQVPLHRRYTAGRLRISLLAPGAGLGQPGAALLKTPLEVGPPDSLRRRRTMLRLNLRSAQLALPPTGVYVLVEGLPTQPTDEFLRTRYVARGKRRKDGSQTVRPYVLTRHLSDTTTHWTPLNDFPHLRQSSPGYVSNTWSSYDAGMPLRRESASGFRGSKVRAYDTVVQLELESAE